MRDIILKLNPVTQNLTKLTATNPIKGSQANDVYYLYAPYGSNAALIKFLPQKFFNTNGTNPVPAIKMTQETDIEVIAAKIPEGDLEDSWSLYYLRVDYGISAILQSQQASQYKVGFTELDVDLDDEEYIGEYATASEVDATINAELKVEFASATTDDFVNVYKTTSNDYTSWLFDGTDWADQDELLNLQVAANTNVFTETFKQAVFSNDDFNMGTPEAQAQVLNQIYAELANLNALVEALTGGTVSFMEIADYDTEASATESVKWARNLGTSTGSISYAEQLAKNALIDQDVTVDSEPTFETVNVNKVDFVTREITDNPTEETLDVKLNDNVTGEMFLVGLKHCINKTGATITDGSVVYLMGASGNTPQIALASNDVEAKAHATIGLATEDIANNESGFVNLWGSVSNLDTSAFSEGDTLWLGSNGSIVNVQPVPPLFNVRLGIVLTSNAGNGKIDVTVDKVHKIAAAPDVLETSVAAGDILRRNSTNEYYENTDGLDTFSPRTILNGGYVETFDFRYNATTSQMELTKSASDPTFGTAPNNLTQQWSDGNTNQDITSCACTPLFGTTTIPSHNYFYVLQTAKTTVAVSTSGWPTTEHIKIAECVFLDEVSTDADGGPLRNQNVNNHNTNTNKIGSINDIRERVRAMGANWESGVGGATAGDWVNATNHFTSQAGTVWQMHLQTFDAKDTSAGDDIHVVNDFTAPYSTINQFSEITAYSDGSAIGNQYFNVFVWGSINKTGEYDAIFINVPTDGYTSLDNAKEDSQGTLVTTVPTAFRKTAFPICRLIFRKLGGTYTFEFQYDLRETQFGVGGVGGGTAQDDEFTDNLFRVVNITDETKKLAFDVSPVSTATTRTITMANVDIDLQDIIDNTTELGTKVDAILYNDTSYVVLTSGSAAGTEYVYVDDAGSKRKMTLDEVAAYANTATGAFVPTADYSGDGLGANKSAFVTLHIMAVDTGADVKIDIKAPTTNQIANIMLPTISSTDNLRLSFDDGVTYHTVLFNGNGLNASTVSNKIIEVYFDGTNWNYEGTMVIESSQSSQERTVSTFETVNPINGSPELELNGLTGNNVITNGDFANGTTGFTATGASFTVTTGIATFLANSQFDELSSSQNLVAGDKYFIVGKVSATDSNVKLYLGDGTNILVDSHSGSGEYEILSGLVTVTLTTSSGKIKVQDNRASAWDNILIDYLYAIPLNTLPTAYQSYSASKLANIFDTYFEGYQDVVNPSIDFTGVNLFDGEWEEGSFGSTGGEDSLTGRIRTKNYIPVIEGETYALLNENSYTSGRVVQYDSSFNAIDIGFQSGTITAVDNASYVRYSYIELTDPVTSTELAYQDTMQQGTVATAYTAYNSDTITLNETFRSVGTVQDKAVFKSQNWFKQAYVGYDFNDVVQNAPGWSVANILTNTHQFQLGLTTELGYKVPATNGDLANIQVSIGDDVYNTVIENVAFNTDTENLFSVNSNNTSLRFRVNKTTYPDGASFEAYLQANDVTFYYELDEMVETEIDVDGGMICEEVTTVSQSQDLPADITLTYPLNKDKQVETNVKNIGYALDSIDTLETSKVDIVSGKELSTNDYTDIDKAKVDFITVTQSVNLDTMETDIADINGGTTSLVVTSSAFGTPTFNTVNKSSLGSVDVIIVQVTAPLDGAPVDGDLLGTLPAGYRPTTELKFAVANTTGAGVAVVKVETDGDIRLVGTNVTSGIECNITFFTV